MTACASRMDDSSPAAAGKGRAHQANQAPQLLATLAHLVDGLVPVEIVVVDLVERLVDLFGGDSAHAAADRFIAFEPVSHPIDQV